MCLIIVRHGKYKDKDISLLDWNSAVTKNGDGIGVMYPIKGLAGRPKLVVDKMLGDSKLIREFYEEHNAKSRENFGVMATHLRKTTSGETNLDNAHPHMILSREHGDDFDLWMMHNGTINKLGDKDTSDSVHLAYNLRGLLKRKPSMIKDPFFQDMLEYYIQNNTTYTSNMYQSKLVFMDGLGKIYYINKKAGVEKDNMWYSNTYSLANATGGTTPTQTKKSAATGTTLSTTQKKDNIVPLTSTFSQKYKKEIVEAAPKTLKNRHGNIRKTSEVYFRNVVKFGLEKGFLLETEDSWSTVMKLYANSLLEKNAKTTEKKEETTTSKEVKTVGKPLNSLNPYEKFADYGIHYCLSYITADIEEILANSSDGYDEEYEVKILEFIEDAVCDSPSTLADKMKEAPELAAASFKYMFSVMDEIW